MPTFCFIVARDFPPELKRKHPKPSLYVVVATGQGPFRGEVFEGTETKVRLDDDIQRGAFGLTADKTSKATGSDNRASGTGKRGARGADPHVANALRNAYQQAVSEDVPQEFLDLLGKLS
jgi:hypothetical protein